MFCGRCDGNRCEQMMSLATCTVRPWANQQEDTNATGTCANTGSGALGQAIYDENSWNTRGRLVHSRCYRNGTDFDTEEECLPTSVCPQSWTDFGGRVYSECSSTFCYKPELLNDTACWAFAATNQYLNGWHWRDDFANRTGLV
jgi:hypothetical protein